MHHTYIPQGTCSCRMDFDIDNDGRLHNLRVTGGCNGNLQGISALVEGAPACEVAARLRGIRCGAKSTSCPDQLACAIAQVIGNEQ